MKSFLRRYRNWIILAVLVVGGGAVFAYFQMQNSNGTLYDAVVVEKGTIDQSIEVTGTLEPSETIDLSFQGSGLVAEVAVRVGDRLTQGQVLGRLENADEAARVSEAQASLNEARASLNLEAADAKLEDVAIAQADVDQASSNLVKVQVELDNAQNQLDNVKKSVEQDVAVAEISLQDAELNLEKVKQQSQQGTSGDVIGVESTSLVLKSTMGTLLAEIASAIEAVDLIYGLFAPAIIDRDFIQEEDVDDFLAVRDLLVDNQEEYQRLYSLYLDLPARPQPEDFASIFADLGDLNKAMLNMTLRAIQVANDSSLDAEYFSDDLVTIRSEIQGASVSLTSAVSSYESAKRNYDDSVLEQSTGSVTDVLDVESAELLVTQRTQELEKTKVEGDIRVDDAENNVKSLEADVKVQEALIQSAEANLNKVLSDPRDVDLGPFRARVDQAEARLLSAQADLSETILQAPIDGVLTNRNVDFGEQVTVGSAAGTQVAFQMIDDNEFHIDVNVPETQISKIGTESDVEITFDSLGREEPFKGQIVSVEPGATEIDDIVYYIVKVALVEKDERLKAGMTADVLIKADPKEGVLIVPEIAVFREDGLKWVRIPTNNPRKNDQVEVRTGVRGSGGRIEIVHGLEEGQTILVPKQ